MVTHLFAYGTLQPTLAPDAVRPIVAGLRRVGRGTAAGEVFDLGEYPAAVFAAGSAAVHGTVYELPPGAEADVLPALDAYEGVPDLYLRLAVAVTLDGGRPLTCWAYQFNRDLTGRQPIPTGVYDPEQRT